MTLLVTAVAALWARCIILPRAWPVAAGSLALLVLPYVFPAAPAPVADTEAPVVRLIQPNAPQHLKWRQDMIPSFLAARP